ncbi:MAG: GNAT family N-acetyltransferase [Planctomycetota bacterium]
MTQPLLIRNAAASDAATIADFNARMARETEGRNLDAERLAAGTRAVFEDRERGFYVVAERDGALVACLLVTREWSDWRNGWFWWIQSVYVLPDARRGGVYRAMYRWLEARARDVIAPAEDAPIVGLRLYVERENATAITTYEALGMSRAHYQLYELDFVLGSIAKP